MNPSNSRGKRNLFCPSYSQCLDHVIDMGWMDWNCSKCEQRHDKETDLEIPLSVNHHIAYYEISTKIGLL